MSQMRCSGYWKKKKLSTEIQEWNLGSINLDRIIRMLSFFKQMEKWIFCRTYRTLRISWGFWLFLTHKLLNVYSLKIETLLINAFATKLVNSDCLLCVSAYDLTEYWPSRNLLNECNLRCWILRGMLAFRE